MNFSIHSFYWENRRHFAEKQKQVFDHFNIPVLQTCATGIQHGVWMDAVLNAATADVILITDIDAIPMFPQTVANDLLAAAEGAIVGCRGMPAHVKPLRDYAGAWWLALRPNLWRAMGSPSAQANDHEAISATDRHVDVAQRITDVARAKGVPLRLYEPVQCNIPTWDLPEKPKAYGIGTLYENGAYHLFESREDQNFKLFEAACDLALKN